MLRKQASRLLSPPTTPSSPKQKEATQFTFPPNFSTLRPSTSQNNMHTTAFIQSQIDRKEDAGCEPLLEEYLISPAHDTKSYQPSAQLAAKWMEFLQDKMNAEALSEGEFDDSEDDDDELPSYESVLATAVTLVAPGKPKVVDVSPPGSIRGTSRSNIKSDRHDHSRSSSWFSESNCGSRPSSIYSNSDRSVDLGPNTPESSISTLSLTNPQWPKRASFTFSSNTDWVPAPPPVPRRNPNRRPSGTQTMSCLLQPTDNDFEANFDKDPLKRIG